MNGEAERTRYGFSCYFQLTSPIRLHIREGDRLRESLADRRLLGSDARHERLRRLHWSLNNPLINNLFGRENEQKY